MLGRTYEREFCSAARALEVIGERWSLLIVRNALFLGQTRFSDFQRSLGMAPNILSSRLGWFVETGLMAQEGGDGGEYRLTPKGAELARVIVALTEWGDRWAAPAGPPLVYEHAGCGGRLHQHVTCAACGADPSDEDVVARPGPGYPA